MDDFDMEHAADSNDCVMAELPYSIEESPLLGRHLVAQRNLDRGELILCEKPIGKIWIRVLDVFKIRERRRITNLIEADVINKYERKIKHVDWFTPVTCDFSKANQSALFQST